MKKKELYCQACGSSRIAKWGSRKPEGKSGSRKQRYHCQECGSRKHPVTTPPDIEYKLPTSVPKSDRYVITCAQNGTEPHMGFLAALKAYCRKNKAALVVIPIRYKNPTSVFPERHQDRWDPALEQYLCAGRGKLNKNLVLLGDVPVQPTAVTPLSGMEAVTKWQSGIIGHPKLALATIPTPNQLLPKVMTTTGAITKRNYTHSKAGKKGEFHHTFGAAVVEIQDAETFHLRQINALDDGSFIDLDREYLPNGRTRKAKPAAALTLGDTHVHWACPDVDNATFWAKDSIVNTLRPQYLLWHDVLDQYARGHHDLKDPFMMYGKASVELDLVENEVKEAIQFVKERTLRYQRSVLVPSNHVEHLNKWLRETDWRTDPRNASFYLKTAAAMVQETYYDHEKGGVKTPDAFRYWFETLEPEFFSKHIEAPSESFMIEGVECALHGDVGPNGARGSIRGFSRIGVKTNIGHSHTPGIMEGCYQSGTSSLLKLQYTRGPSSWQNSHIVVYANGKRSLITILGGKWRS